MSTRSGAVMLAVITRRYSRRSANGWNSRIEEATALFSPGAPCVPPNGSSPKKPGVYDMQDVLGVK